jgi:hypothetical protein
VAGEVRNLKKQRLKLLGQNQLVLAGQSQTILIVAVLDNDFARLTE